MLYFIGMIVICAYVAIIVGSIILLILKVIERKKRNKKKTGISMMIIKFINFNNYEYF
ncbi:hypothetical protein QJS64_14840 [Paraclostridium bifermentans]|uniref:Uncharacterized protein n=1 Tax=Paraclostridium bifermentans TaxID=1490 RepID=A0ABY8R167_PARBF|nr:hypothetical protein QJS64_14840 [Paraclostridium bifermentans]